MASLKSRWLTLSGVWCYRVLGYAVLAAGLAFAAIVLSLRYWVLPNIEQYREDIAAAASRAAKQRITIGKITASWEGLRPHLVLADVEVFDAAGRSALRLARVDNTLSWLSLVYFEPRLYSLEIHRPSLSVRRSRDGAITVAGIALAASEEGGFSDWMLRQREILVRNAMITWQDDMRGAPPLELANVNLHLDNRGGRHRFGLRATPPGDLAGPLDLRGDLRGGSFRDPGRWRGQLFVQLDYADIAAWRAWVPFPIEFPRGTGALRMWLTFEGWEPLQVVADVRLANVRTRLAPELKELDLTDLTGRVAWRRLERGSEVSASKLALVTQGGLALQPVDFLLRLIPAGGSGPARGELQANALELEPLMALAEHLPLDAELRARLAEFSPKGSLFDTVVKWVGVWPRPAQYSAKGRFHNVSLKANGKVPGFGGMSGNLDGTERGGTLYLNTRNATLHMPLAFRDRLEFDVLVAQVGWSRGGKQFDLRFNNVSFSNAHLAGTVFGTYRSVAERRGVIDLTGQLTHADARYVSRYVPLVIGKATRDWLDTALVSGRSNDVSLRLKGDLNDFPFTGDKGGTFQVAARVTGGTLHYADGWPRIEHISGDLVFRGIRLDVNAREATILGARLAKVHAEIPDLKIDDEVLRITGEAEGPTAEFLGFIGKSPVLEMIDRFTEGMKAQGRGRLALKLELPLRRLKDSRIAGGYQFLSNQLVADADLPPLEGVNGRLEFTESGVRVQNATANFAGGPATISAATQRDGTVRVTAQGRASGEALRGLTGNAALQALRGTTDWRGTVTLRKKLADVVIETNLQGVASDLPAPLAKTANEAIPLRLEKRVLNPQQDHVLISYGDAVSAQLVRRKEGAGTVIERGTVSFGGTAASPERAGVAVSGTLQSLDFDDWLSVVNQSPASARVVFSNIDVKIGELDVFGRRFHDLAIRAASQGENWQSRITAREVEGDANWQPRGKGRLVARMKRLAIPAATASRAAPALEKSASEKPPELPTLDVTVEQFQVRDKLLGKLELVAVAEARDWRIERLRITNPESMFTVDGVWQGWLSRPRTQVNVKLEASDVGKLLARLGYPEGVRRGTAKLEGPLSWAGSPQDLDFPTLSGNLVVEAARGQFVKLEPGIGKLLGILSLQALPRRVTLDFRDIFSEGLAFDEIIGALKIQRGIASTENFRIQGPSARIIMGGDVDLVRETQKLHVRVTPSVGDSVAVAGALIGGPVAGIAAFLAQKVLKDPLDRLASFEYSITGTWAEPNVSKLEPQPQAAEKQ
ncbi:MAG: TIGR02099 family protein [Betaproteobacteria bacterium]|nr:TIGR02099 family protein [Betaproteobacteria bacterium]